jgi:hypothetical protein
VEKKSILNGVFIFLLISLGIVGWFWTEVFGFTKTDITGDSIEDAIYQFTSTTGQPYKYGETLERVKIQQNIFLVFTLDQNRNSIYSSIIKKKWNGNWKVVSMSGNAPTERHPTESNPYYWVGIGNDDITGYWGVIYDSKVKKIILSDKGERANILDLPNIPRIWYKVYQPNKQSRNIDIKAIDSSGNEVPWSPKT